MGMILRIASSRIVGQGDIVGRSGYFSLNLSANSVMRGRLDARRTLKSLVADLRLGISVVYRACGFRVCLHVWDRFYLSPSHLLISRWGGCSIEQQEETGQALFFPLAIRGF